MRILPEVWLLCFVFGTGAASAQSPKIEPRVTTLTKFGEKVTLVEVAPRFVTAIRLPETVNSIVVGDPSAFEVEHSDHEPRLVFVKSLSVKPGESNLLISTAGGHEVSLLLTSRGESSSPGLIHVDFLLKYEAFRGFFIAPSALPFAVVGATVPLVGAGAPEGETGSRPGKPAEQAGADVSSFGDPLPARSGSIPQGIRGASLEKLVEQQERAPLPVLYGQRVGKQAEHGDRVRAGVGRVMDGGQQVVVLFSVVNPTRHAILLMPPQVQLGGRTAAGKLIRRARWSAAEQLPVLDFRLNRRRLGPAQRADGAVVFVRPPYKQSNETLLLQVAESGAVDCPALAPIGFGISTGRENENGSGE